MASRRRALALLGAAPLLALAPRRAPAADAATLLAQVRARLEDAPVLRGSFEQRRTLKGFRNPLVSRGDFVVARQRGVIWRTREPFASTLVVTRDRLATFGADGKPTGATDGRDEPGVKAVNSLLFALLAADLPALAERFRIEGDLVGADGWRLALTPRESTLAQWIARIELDGDRHLRALRVSETGGDATAVRVSGVSAAPALAADEEARLG